MAGMTSSALWGLVLAGGDGVRLQPLTRRLTGRPIPKQYCRLTGDRSMLQSTLTRIAPLVAATRTMTLINRDHLPVAEEQLRGVPASNVLVQPCNRDTGPGLLFGLMQLARRDPDATVAVFPSDHYIRDDGTFLDRVAAAADLVRHFPDRIVLLGMSPDRADPGLGYVAIGSPVPGRTDAYRVAAFVEKPGPTAAQTIIRNGGLWNSFVMVFRVQTMWSLLRRVRPSESERMAGPVDAAYASLPAWNFSRDFLSLVPRELVVVRVPDIGWSDWGTLEAIERTLRSLNVVPPWRAAGQPAEAAA